jgi:hypothetical protein
MFAAQSIAGKFAGNSQMAKRLTSCFYSRNTLTLWSSPGHQKTVQSRFKPPDPVPFFIVTHGFIKLYRTIQPHPALRQVGDRPGNYACNFFDSESQLPAEPKRIDDENRTPFDLPIRIDLLRPPYHLHMSRSEVPHRARMPTG